MSLDLYSPEFFRTNAASARKSAAVIVPLVLDLIPCRSVLDVGCGTGTWLAVFAEHGVTEVRGLDGEYVDRAQLEIADSLFEATDLTRPFATSRTFDLVTCLEVAEHLPEASADGLVSSLAGSAPVVLFSAAIPYQGGRNHINEQWPEYWAERFAKHGFVPIDCLRRRLLSSPEVEWWYAQNTIIYARESERARFPELWSHYREWERNNLSIVHAHCYLNMVQWGLSRDAEVHRLATG